MAVVVWSPTARSHLRDTHDRIARDSILTAEKWVLKILKAIDRLESLPEIGSPVEEPGYNGFRELLVGPYRIIYRYTGTECRIGAIVRGERDLNRAVSPDELT
jgi:plasmid stabilization system protein ParE